MSCQFCSGSKDALLPTVGGVGRFYLAGYETCDDQGWSITVPCIRYEAEDMIFDHPINIEDHVLIHYCPMCSRKF